MQVNTTIESAIVSVLPKIFGIAKQLDWKNGDDIAQDVVLKLLEIRPDVRQVEHDGWLYSVIRNAAVDRRRAEKREAQYLDRLVSLDISGSRCEGLNEHTLYVPQTLEPKRLDDCSVPIVREKLQELPEQQRQVLDLLAAGNSYTAIAEITGASMGTVRSRIHYARKRAQKLLDPVLKN